MSVTNATSVTSAAAVVRDALSAGEGRSPPGALLGAASVF